MKLNPSYIDGVCDYVSIKCIFLKSRRSIHGPYRLWGFRTLCVCCTFSLSLDILASRVTRSRSLSLLYSSISGYLLSLVLFWGFHKIAQFQAINGSFLLFLLCWCYCCYCCYRSHVIVFSFFFCTSNYDFYQFIFTANLCFQMFNLTESCLHGLCGRIQFFCLFSIRVYMCVCLVFAAVEPPTLSVVLCFVLHINIHMYVVPHEFLIYLSCFRMSEVHNCWHIQFMIKIT